MDGDIELEFIGSFGRPTKYKPEYGPQIVDFMATGKSLVQFAAHIGVHKDTVYEWTKVYPEFSDFLKLAQTRCEAFWENVIQTKTVKKIPGSDPLLMFMMKNRFKWAEKTTSEITSKETITFTTQIGDDGEVYREES